MAESSLDTARQQTALDVEWKAFELRPKGAPPIDPGYKAMIERNWPRTQAMGRQFGVEMRTHRFGIDTRPAHRAFKIVQRLSPPDAEDFHHAIFRAYFEEDHDIGDVAVLVSLAESLGIDGEALRAGLERGEALREVIEEEHEAYSAGISGVPAFVFVDKYLLSGVHPPEAIVRAAEQVRADERGAGARPQIEDQT